MIMTINEIYFRQQGTVMKEVITLSYPI